MISTSTVGIGSEVYVSDIPIKMIDPVYPDTFYIVSEREGGLHD